jgi:hypothetical protein
MRSMGRNDTREQAAVAGYRDPYMPSVDYLASGGHDARCEPDYCHPDCPSFRRVLSQLDLPPGRPLGGVKLA